MSWLVLLVAAPALLATILRVRRYTQTHVTVQLTIAGRGLYVSHTADGWWWRLRFRRRCATTACGDLPDDPGGAGSREPRHPSGSGPWSGSVRLAPPR